MHVNDLDTPALILDLDGLEDNLDRYQRGAVVDYLEQEHTRPFLAVASLNNPHDICNWIGSFEGEHEDIAPPAGELPPVLTLAEINADLS